MSAWVWLVVSAFAQPTPQVDPPSVDALAEVQAVFDRVERFQGVRLERDGAVIRIRGEVPTLEARDEAATLATSIPDHRFVDNLVAVEPGPPGSRERRREDVSVEGTLRGVFARVPALDGVEVSVEGGVVHLGGTVLDADLITQAERLVESMEGVVWVDNQLEATTDVRERLAPALSSSTEQFSELLARLPLLVVALGIMGIAWMLGRALSRWRGLLMRVSERPLLRSVVGGLVHGAVFVTGLLIALELLDATSLVGAVVGTAGVFGLAVGFAFQDIVENYLAGVLLAIQQPFAKDDFIEVSGTAGSVVRMTSRNTLLLSADGNHVFIPNATVFKNQMINYTRNPERRFDFAVGVGVDEDLAEVIRVGIATLADMVGVADTPSPSIRIEALGDSSVVVRVYGWVDQTQHSYLAVRTEAIRRIKEAFDAAGFDMPEPIYRVSMTQATQPKKSPPKPRATDAAAVDLQPVDELEHQRDRERLRHGEEDLLVAAAP